MTRFTVRVTHSNGRFVTGHEVTGCVGRPLPLHTGDSIQRSARLKSKNRISNLKQKVHQVYEALSREALCTGTDSMCYIVL